MAVKFLVCTMYCGELDFPHHVAALRDQGVEVEHRVFRDMVEVDAHNAVYQAFNGAPPDTIRAKVDADVVLFPGALASAAGAVGPNTWLDPTTHDYFTDSKLHAGVAIYGPNVRFSTQRLTLKCDRDVSSQCSPMTHGCVGRHAHYADEWAGFHFGFHRGLKSQLQVFDDVRRAHAHHGDRVRLMAFRGFEVAQSDLYIDWHVRGGELPMDHNYGNPRLRELFETYKDDAVPLPPRTWR